MRIRLTKKFAFGVLMVPIFLVMHWVSFAAVIPPPKTLLLKWDYTQVSPDIVFNVYSTTNLGVPIKKWTRYTNVTTTSCVVQVQPGNRFFAVTASNTVSRLESAYGR